MHGGSAHRDYTTQYLPLCKHFGGLDEQNRAFLSEASMNAGAHQCHFINTSESGDEAMFDHQAPGGAGTTSLELVATLHSAPSANVTLVMVQLHAAAVYIDPTRGTVDKSW